MHKKINELFCTIAGFRPSAIARSQDALGLPATFGLLLVLVSMISGVTMAYALFRVFYGDSYALLVAVLGGLLWFPLIFCVDRLMLNTSTSGPTWAKSIKIGGRFALAIIVGLTISTPVFLRLQRNNIDLGIFLSNRDMVAQQASENANLAGLPGSQTEVTQAHQEALDAQKRIATGPGADPQYASAVRAREAAEAAEREAENLNLPVIVNARSRLTALPPNSPDAIALRGRIQELNIPITQAKRAVARAVSDVEQAEQSWRKITDQQLKTAQDHEQTSRKTRDAAKTRTDKADADSSKQIEKLSTPNLATEFASAERIMNDPSNPQSASMRKSAYFIHGLFIVIELTIVSLKLTSGTGALDHATAAREEEDREHNTILGNNRILRMQSANEAATDIYLGAMLKFRSTRRTEIAAQTNLSTADLRALKVECEDMIEASF